MANAAEDAVHELEAALAEQQPLTEGARDFGRLNLEGPAAASMSAALNDYARRESLIRNALVALQDLIRDGYPETPVRVVPQSVFEDLKANADTINAALGKFASEPAVASLNPVVGSPEPKEEENDG